MPTSRQPESTKRKPGRPSTYTPELAERICTLLEAGRSLRSICAQDDMPPQGTVFRWLDDPDNSAFREQYARARSLGIDVMAEEALEIANDRTDDANSRRVRVDTIKWFASKLRPDRYGDRGLLELGGAGGSTLRIIIDHGDR